MLSNISDPANGKPVNALLGIILDPATIAFDNDGDVYDESPLM